MWEDFNVWLVEWINTKVMESKGFRGIPFIPVYRYKKAGLSGKSSNNKKNTTKIFKKPYAYDTVISKFYHWIS